jgi:hypothetical protein
MIRRGEGVSVASLQETSSESEDTRDRPRMFVCCLLQLAYMLQVLQVLQVLQAGQALPVHVSDVRALGGSRESSVAGVAGGSFHQITLKRGR